MNKPRTQNKRYSRYRNEYPSWFVRKVSALLDVLGKKYGYMRERDVKLFEITRLSTSYLYRVVNGGLPEGSLRTFSALNVIPCWLDLDTGEVHIQQIAEDSMEFVEMDKHKKFIRKFSREPNPLGVIDLSPYEGDIDYDPE